MEREKLLEEYKVTLESLVEKTKFCYSEEFYKLDEFEKQKYQKDKMATEGHLATLCNLLCGAKIQLNSGLADMFALSIIGSMFNGGGFGSMPSSADYLKEALKEDENKEKEEVFAIPVK
jgi:CTP-dependent riboflavin kinase